MSDEGTDRTNHTFVSGWDQLNTYEASVINS